VRKVSNANLLKEEGALTACWLKKDPWMGSKYPRKHYDISSLVVKGGPLCKGPRFRMRSYSVRLRSDCAVQDWELSRPPLWTRAGDGFWR